MYRRIIEGWVRFSLRRPWECALGSLLFTGLAIWAASHITLKTDLAALLPRTYHSVQELDRVKQKVGGLDKIVLVIESPDSAANHRFAIDVGRRLQEQREINYVEWSQDMSFFGDRKLLYMDLADLRQVYRRVSSKAQMDLFSEPLDFSDIEKKYASSDTTKKDAWATGDGTIRLVLAYPSAQSADISASRQLIAMTKRVVAQVNPAAYNSAMQVSYGGDFKNRVDEYEGLKRDIFSTTTISVIGIILTISLYFRQGFAWFYIGYPLIAGLGWTFGIAALTVGHLNLVTGFLIAALTGLGIDFGIHVFSRYIEERGRGCDLSEAVRLAVVNTGAALFTSATTTVAAFYALMITDFKGFSEFGFIAGTGIIMTLTAVLVSFPAFIFIGEHFHLVRHRQAVKGWGQSGSRFPFVRGVVFGTVIVLSVAVVLAARIQFEYDFSRLRADIPAAAAVKAKIAQIQTMESSPAAVVVEDPATRQEVYRTLKERQKTSSTIKEVRTVESFLPDQQDEKMRIIRRLRNVVKGREDKLLGGQTKIAKEDLDHWLNVEPVTVSDLPDFITRKFRGPDGTFGQFVMIGTSVSLRDGKQVIAFADEVRKIETPDHGTFYSSGSAVIFADMLLVMEHDSLIAISVTLLVVLALVLADFGTRKSAALALAPLAFMLLLTAMERVFGVRVSMGLTATAWTYSAVALAGVALVAAFDARSLRASALVMTPLLGGVVLMLGIIPLFGIKLNFYNMVALPSILGMGVDNGVHMCHRYREEGRGSIMYVLKTTGGAALMASLTTMEGFGGMLTAKHQGLFSLGEVSMIGMGMCLYMSVIFLPALLSYLEARGAGRPTVETGEKKPTAMPSYAEG